MSTSTVLSSAATTICHSSPVMRLKWSMSATPGGTKKKPRLATRKSAIPLTHSKRMSLIFNSKVSRSIPIMLDGTVMPVSHTTNSPTARQPKSMAHCLIIFPTLKNGRKGNTFTKDHKKKGQDLRPTLNVFTTE